MEEVTLFSKFIQFGFAGFAFILIGVIVWLIKQLLGILKENNKIIADNSEAIRCVGKSSADCFKMQVELKDHLLRRPCLIPREDR